uniref:Collagen triple helix repeat protein n=1 Tax=Bursaphelenchus xylophilus TaxID=6326 RepID=A0A1I7SBB1_BURXY
MAKNLQARNNLIFAKIQAQKARKPRQLSYTIIPDVCGDCAILSCPAGDPGPAGPPGLDGIPGEIGKNGKAGDDGYDVMIDDFEEQHCIICPSGPPGQRYEIFSG